MSVHVHRIYYTTYLYVARYCVTLCGLVLRSTYMTLNESIFETVQSGCIKTVIDSVPSV